MAYHTPGSADHVARAMPMILRIPPLPGLISEISLVSCRHLPSSGWFRLPHSIARLCKFKTSAPIIMPIKDAVPRPALFVGPFQKPVWQKRSAILPYLPERGCFSQRKMTSTEELKIVKTVSSMQSVRTDLNDTVSLVPTMGVLHEGHLSLIRLAAEQTASVIVSIYANPSQLSPIEDQHSYPSMLDSDMATLTSVDETFRSEGLGRIKAVFVPTDEEMYPFAAPNQITCGHGSYVHILPLSNLLEGLVYPTHFMGVATVCLKLFNIVRPHKVYFGEKDVQQTVIIKRLLLDFFLDIGIVVGPTIREVDGMAMSSRNVFLGSRRRRVGLILIMALRAAELSYREGNLVAARIMASANAVLEEGRKKQELEKETERARFVIDYLALSDPNSLIEIDVVDPAQGAIVSGAIRMLVLENGVQDEDKGWRDGRDEIRAHRQHCLEAKTCVAINDYLTQNERGFRLKRLAANTENRKFPILP